MKLLPKSQASIYVLAACVVLLGAPARADVLRIALSMHQIQAVFASEGGLLVRRAAQAHSAALMPPELTPVVDVHALGGGLLLGGAVMAQTPVSIAPISDAPLMINGRPYRGSALVERDGPATIRVLNAVELEQYLYGVLPSEMTPGWPPAALQAQAIVARTYALAQAGTRANSPFDLRAGEVDQAYNGMDAETPATSAAVDSTRDSVLTYEGQIVHAYYSACDGGYTADGTELKDPQPYLAAAEDPYAAASPHVHWMARIPLARLSAALKQRFGDSGRIDSITAGPADASGRVHAITLGGPGRARTLTAALFRSLAGSHVVKSTRIQSLSLRGDAVEISGAGFGHGVGLSQWEARQMAESGISAQDILRFYYRGATLSKSSGVQAGAGAENRYHHPVSRS